MNKVRCARRGYHPPCAAIACRFSVPTVVDSISRSTEHRFTHILHTSLPP